MFPLPDGVSYNSYLILDEKTAVVDTVDSAITQQFAENITHLLNGRPLDYLIINHMEPDHCASIEDLCRRWPNLKLVGNKKTFQLLSQFYHFDSTGHQHEVKEGDTLCLGSHTLRFVFAPMVHWPEVMFTYECSKSILFSADAFGTFGALSGNVFADQTDFEGHYLDEARRYYTNIVGKYGPQVQAALKKFSGVEIAMICPLHGPVWRENLHYILEKYDRWSRYEPEKKGIVLAYASMYGNTANTVDTLASMLSELGVTDMRVYDVSKTHPSYIIADAFKYSHLVAASPTYNMGLYHMMDSFLRELGALMLRDRKTAVIGCYSWACASTKAMVELLSGMKGMAPICEPFEIRSSLKEEQLPALRQLAQVLADSLKD